MKCQKAACSSQTNHLPTPSSMFLSLCAPQKEEPDSIRKVKSDFHKFHKLFILWQNFESSYKISVMLFGKWMAILSYGFHCLHYRMATMETYKTYFSKGGNKLVIWMDAIKIPLHSFSDFHNFLSGKKPISTLLGIKQPAWKYTRKTEKTGNDWTWKGKI